MIDVLDHITILEELHTGDQRSRQVILGSFKGIFIPESVDIPKQRQMDTTTKYIFKIWLVKKRANEEAQVSCSPVVIDNPDIAQYYGSFEGQMHYKDAYVQTYVNCFEYIPGYDLYDMLRFHKEIDIMDVALRLTNILFKLHKAQWYHRDIKLENVIYNPKSDRLCLIDNDLARDEERKVGIAPVNSGTLLSLPKHKRYCSNRKDHLAKLDWWALSILLSSLITRKHAGGSREMINSETTIIESYRNIMLLDEKNKVWKLIYNMARYANDEISYNKFRLEYNICRRLDLDDDI